MKGWKESIMRSTMNCSNPRANRIPQLRSSIDRPAWTTKDIKACDNKYTWHKIKYGYYLKTKGLE